MPSGFPVASSRVPGIEIIKIYCGSFDLLYSYPALSYLSASVFIENPFFLL